MVASIHQSFHLSLFAVAVAVVSLPHVAPAIFYATESMEYMSIKLPFRNVKVQSFSNEFVLNRNKLRMHFAKFKPMVFNEKNESKFKIDGALMVIKMVL